MLPGENIVVGVSGGVDSSALLHILWSLNKQYQYGWRLYAVHLNHCFRGEESRLDALYVQSLAEQLAIPCFAFERDIPLYMEKTGMGAEEASREVRYELFREVAEQVGATKVVLAHHADDQVETVLFRMVRGTRLAGLAGIPVRRWLVPGKVEVVRPLLATKRSQLEAYCREHALSPREDSSNQSRKFKRNLIRLEIAPLLEEVNARYREHILELAAAVRQDEAFLTKMSQNQLNTVIMEQTGNKVVISGKKLQSCDLALQRRMINLILSYLSNGIEWSSQHVEAVLNLIQSNSPSAVIHLPERMIVKRSYEQVSFLFSDSSEKTHSFCYELMVPGSTYVWESNATIRTSLHPHFSDWNRLPANAIVLDAERLPGKLLIRNRLPGDRIKLFGTKASKKLKDLLIDAKVPKSYREKIPVLVSGEEIVWVPKLRRSSTAVVTRETTRFLMVEVEYGEDWQEVFQ
ncbi:tRNA lysidine(34) synthetase TilS [Brevibacillus fulvus]|uniref:tRNA(Ile)-lysidine synthase n=1 Tax=Brevibacillus fulvus TaxID=1125967 RepID=A0A938Y4K3_9BACL|nr:tRNA(Ile)-lysidine synthase [Brevibacillus fulvus]